MIERKTLDLSDMEVIPAMFTRLTWFITKDEPKKPAKANAAPQTTTAGTQFKMTTTPTMTPLSADGSVSDRVRPRRAATRQNTRTLFVMTLLGPPEAALLLAEVSYIPTELSVTLLNV